jgi:hypothetical protein
MTEGRERSQVSHGSSGAQTELQRAEALRDVLDLAEAIDRGKDAERSRGAH